MSKALELQQTALAAPWGRPGVPAGHIAFAARRGIVTLTGHGDSGAAERGAFHVTGVVTPTGQIAVRPNRATEPSGVAIASASVEPFAAHAATPNDAVTVGVEQGRVPPA